MIEFPIVTDKKYARLQEVKSVKFKAILSRQPLAIFSPLTLFVHILVDLKALLQVLKIGVFSGIRQGYW